MFYRNKHNKPKDMSRALLTLKQSAAIEQIEDHHETEALGKMLMD
jgi:hypothetical protein